MNQLSRLLLIIFTVCIFSACSGTDNLSTNPADIQGEWELTSINGKNLMAQGEGNAYTLSFNADSTIAGKADCNYYVGRYTANQTEEQGTLNLQEVSTTKAECEGKSQYRTFVKAVMRAESFQVEGGNQLILSGGGGDGTKVVFNRLAAEETQETTQETQEG